MERKININFKNILYGILIIAIPCLGVSGVSVIPSHLRFYGTIAVGIICLLLTIFVKKTIIIDAITVPILFLCGVMVTSATYSIDNATSIQFAVIYLCCASIIFVDLPEKMFERILTVTKIICLIIALSIIVSAIIPNFINDYCSFLINPGHKSEISEAISNEIKFSHAYSGLATERADAAFIVNIGIAIMFGKYFSGEKLRWYGIVQLLIFVSALFLTNKRTLFIVPIIAFLLLMLMGNIKSKLIKFVSIVILAVGLFSILSVYIPQLSNIYNRFFVSSSNDALNGRGELWPYSWLMFSKNPIVGLGFGAFNLFANRCGLRINGEPWKYYGHNCYIEILGELGIIGTIIFAVAFIVPIIYTIVMLYRKSGTKTQLMLLMFSFYVQLMCFIYSFSGNVIYYNQQVVMWFFAIAITLYVKRKTKIKLFSRDKTTKASKVGERL